MKIERSKTKTERTITRDDLEPGRVYLDVDSDGDESVAFLVTDEGHVVFIDDGCISKISNQFTSTDRFEELNAKLVIE